MSFLDTLSGADSGNFTNSLLGKLGINSNDIGGSLGDIIGKNLNYAIQKNTTGGQQNPAVVPAPGATQSMPAGVAAATNALSQYSTYIVGGIVLVGIVLVMRRR